MDPVTIGIFVVSGLLAGGAIALRQSKVTASPPKSDDGSGEPADIALKIPEGSSNREVDRHLK